MLNEADLVQRYPDLLSSEVDPEVARLVGDLDEASAAYRAIEPPAALLAAIDQLASDHSNEQAPQPRVHVPRGFASANPPPAQSGPGTGKHRHLLPSLAQKRWLRQSTELAAGILALVLFAGLFVTLLSHTGSLSGTTEPGAQPTPATLDATPTAPKSALDFDPDVRNAYDTGLGKKLNLAQSAEGFTVSLEWAFAQDHWIYVYYTITVPSGKAFSNVELLKLKVTDGEGNVLPARGGMGAGWPDRTRNYLTKLDASDTSVQAGIITLHLQSPGLWTTVPGDPNGTATSMVVPYGPDGLPVSGCQPNQPTCPFSVPGPFSFDFTLPYKPEPQASAPPVATRVMLEQATEQVRGFLGEPNTDLKGKLIDTATADSEENIFFPPRPNAKLWVLTHKWKNGENPDTFIVDADSGDILKVVIPSRASDDLSQQPISDSDAMAIAEEFARAHFAGFDQLTKVDNDPVAAGVQYLLGPYDPKVTSPPVMFHWQLRSTDSDVSLPTFVSVGIDSKNGNVIRYVARPADGQPEAAEPLVNRERAIQIALSEAGKEPQNIGVSVSKIELKTLPSNNGENQLYWSVDLTGTAPANPGAGRVSGYEIDARTGEIHGTRMMVGNETPPEPSADSAGPPA
ncbi:PepSY domain-containing protein [Nitrolancea hollandica]|uniref:PepSY domain-containing protein n=1 Tax=Nitrolancea hollandica Lb TaxID=1129897 RepID=I4EEV7_9BACT|nr:PepSY domain-containing protein [Nitrolancea hollandica]CCF83219.1 hypothetical protein NITHO_2030011 [Nitrolancea hollandica Lb]